MSRAGWQVTRKVSIVLTSLFVLHWVLLIGGTIFLAVVGGRDAVIRFLRSDDGTLIPFALKQGLFLLLTLATWLISQHAQRHVHPSKNELSAAPSKT
jgi:hypothetical protein